MTARDVLTRAHAFVRDYDLQFADCFAADGVLELPFAPRGMPRRLVGRDAIRRVLEPSYRAARASGRKILDFRDLRIHDTADGAVVVEFTLVGAQPDGTTYELPFVQVVRVRGNEIVEMRDYFDSLAMQSRLTASTAGGPTPRQVFEQIVNGVAAKQWDLLPALYAENAVVTHPHDVPLPSRIEGRAELRAHFARAAKLPITLQVRNMVVHETTDPEVIVAEFDYLGQVTTTNRTFQISNVFVMRIRDGQVVASRDYGNRLALEQALGDV